MDAHGVSLCLQYAYPPNSFHYCGPEKQNESKEYVKTHIQDKGLYEILSHFDTLYPYLKLIAGANGICDPFHRKVVEAYWIGNRLLEKVPKRKYHSLLIDSLSIHKKFKKNTVPTIDAISEYGFPHHTFHVLGIYRRTGKHSIEHTLHTMDSCRIGWGTIQSVNRKTGLYTLSMEHICYGKNGLFLDSPTLSVVSSVDAVYAVGDTVSVHWDMICDVLSKRQILNLRYYTDMAIKKANRIRVGEYLES